MPFQTEREVSGLGRNFRSSFYGKVMYNQNCVRMKTASSQGGRAVVASVVSATSSFFVLLLYSVFRFKFQIFWLHLVDFGTKLMRILAE